MEGLCPHGKNVSVDTIFIETAFCEKCSEADMEILEGTRDYIKAERQSDGLDAPYYDIPKTVTCVQDAIEYMKLNFAVANMFKSIWRQNGTYTKATDEKYETDKRFYFAAREVVRVWFDTGCQDPTNIIKILDWVRERISEHSYGTNADKPNQASGQKGVGMRELS